MVIPQPDLQFLPAVFVLLWPLAIVLPKMKCQYRPELGKNGLRILLHDLTFLDHASDLGNEE